MPLFFHLLVSLAAVAMVLATIGVLPVRKHPLYYVLSLQLLIYCFIAPTYSIYSSGTKGTDLGGWYLYLQSLCLVILIPVFLISYRAAGNACRRRMGNSTLTINRFRLTFFNLFCLVSPLAYLLTLAYFGLLFRRIGHGALAEAYLSLPTLVFWSVRTYDRLLLSLVLASYITFRCSQEGRQRKSAWLGFLLTFSVQVIVTAINSRFQLMNTFALLWLVSLACNVREGKKYRIQIPWQKVVMAMLLLLGLNFTLNFRALWQGSFSETFDISLVYTRVSSAEADDAIGDISNRLDGLNLIAQMAPELARTGYSHGSSWYPSILATFGYLWDPEAAREVKASMGTSPKYFLMYEYAGISLVDYPSCMLTDAYGNFGVFGIFAAAIVLGVGCAIIQQLCVSPPTRLWLVVGIVAIQIITFFEGSFLHHLLLGWFQSLPALLILYFICPLKAVRVRCSVSPRNHHSRISTHATTHSQRLYSRI